MKTAPIFLDANIALYAFGAPSALKAPCARVLRATAMASGAFVTNAEVLQEVLHVLRRRRRWEDARPAYFDLTATLAGAVLPVDGTDVDNAARLVGEGYASPDTRDIVHVVTMRRYGITRIATADRHFDGIPGITRLDPAKLDEWADPGWLG
jgi:predicted nucleic acid-binding protein